MTTFEITIITLLALIAFALIFRDFIIGKALDQIIENQESQYKKLDFINTQIAGIWRGQDKIEDNAAIISSIVDKMHRNLCVEIVDKMVNKMYPVNEGESLDAPFEIDYKLKKDIENKLNGFAAAVLDAECCPQEILDLWTERICESAHKFIKQFKIDWDKLSKEQQDEFLKRHILPNYDKPFQPIYTPCYAPNGICTNPQMDCINCPKRGTGGTWSTNTSIKAEDAPLQKRFNDNKED